MTKTPNSQSSWLKNLFATRVIETVSVALAISLAFFGFSGWTIWNIYRGFRENVNNQFRLQQLSDRNTYIDEVLTMSAYMAASTGDLKWVDRYKEFEPAATETLEEMIRLSPNIKTELAPTESSVNKLLELESRSFELLRQGKREEAAKILFGKEYAQQKEILAQGVKTTFDNLQVNIENQIKSYSDRLEQSVIVAAIGVLLLVFVWIAILSAIRTYVRERNRAQQDLVASQSSLQQLNEELEGRVEQRTQQLADREKSTREESEVLQSDIGNLLEVVSAVEEGNLTVQAPVSTGVTGLVADTFNRLTEELAKVLGQVVVASRQVSDNADRLRQIADTVAVNADRQAQGVTQALDLSEQVERSAQNATNQLQASNQTLLDLDRTVQDGQMAMEGLTHGTEILRQGSDRIVQQMKTLGEFVGLAEQFVQDQGQIASQTQVLALNASLVAARAAEQQNPRQFLVAAREFEAIADQVSKLAQQTNDGLTLLEQRTMQIQNVVALVDAEVQNLSGLVSEFTQGVERSTQTFNNVRSVATNTVRSGETVARSSQEIIDAVRSTATAVRDIAELAQRTAQLTEGARNQSEAVGQLSTQLLQRVEFFRLPDAAVPVNLAQSEESTIDVAVMK